jgi:hypothetical protein
MIVPSTFAMSLVTTELATLWQVPLSNPKFLRLYLCQHCQPVVEPVWRGGQKTHNFFHFHLVVWKYNTDPSFQNQSVCKILSLPVVTPGCYYHDRRPRSGQRGHPSTMNSVVLGEKYQSQHQDLSKATKDAERYRINCSSVPDEPKVENHSSAKSLL